MFLNSLATSVTLGCPYWFSWIYLRKGNYDGLLLYLTNTKKTTHDKVKRYSKIYTCLSIFLWILGGVFFYFHWIPLFRGFKWTLLYYILYFLVGFCASPASSMNLRFMGRRAEVGIFDLTNSAMVECLDSLNRITCQAQDEPR